ncbi:MAG: zinc carboxypeptidase [Myxococcales bacterium]|nr:MAG: zinc carboxypeptidase [Myxococcales bacterium]
MIGVHHEFLELVSRFPRFLRLEALGEVQTLKGVEPIYSFSICDHEQPECGSLPVLALFGGVHGVETIGVDVLHACIEHLASQLSWNEHLGELFRKVRLIGIPVVNPAGHWAETRCNGNGVDLMRNAPVDSPTPTFLFGGQRFSAHLPYYRGGGLELESKLLIDLVRNLVFPAPFGICLDIHSGFGWDDSLWTPYARQKGYPPNWPCYMRLKATLDMALRHHVYKFEPQSENYCAAGDLWDYLMDEHRQLNPDAQGVFLPLTLEIGAWRWIKKSPTRQIRALDLFNPVPPHRRERVLRHHIPLLDLLLSIAANYKRVFTNEETESSPARRETFRIINSKTPSQN